MMQPSQKLTMSLSYRQPQKVLQKHSPKELSKDKPKVVNQPKTQPKVVTTKTPKNNYLKEEKDKQLKVDQVKDKPDERAGAQNKNEKVDDKSSIVRMATPLYHLNPPPKYPQRAKKRGYQGTVLLNVLVEIDGTVSNLNIFQTSGYSMLDRAAKNSVRKWIFSPGKKGAKEVEMWVRVPVRFQLQ